MVDELDADALVAAARRHDESAAREIVRRLYPLVLKLVRSHRPRRTAEEDLCQMIFIKIFQKARPVFGQSSARALGLAHRGQYLPQPDPGRAGAAGISPGRPERGRGRGRAKSRRHCRGARTGSKLRRARPGRAAARRAQAGGATRDRSLYLQQRSVAEIQALTGWGASLVKVRAFRARQKMKRQLDQFSAEGNR